MGNSRHADRKFFSRPGLDVVVYKVLAGNCGPGRLFFVALLRRWEISCPFLFPLWLGFRSSDGSRRSSWRAVFSTLRPATFRFASVWSGKLALVELGCDARGVCPERVCLIPFPCSIAKSCLGRRLPLRLLLA